MPPNLSPEERDQWRKDHLQDQLPRNMKPHEREQWMKDHVPSSVELAASGNFGKPNHDQLFSSDVCLRHVIPFVMDSGFLTSSGKNNDESKLEAAYEPAKVYKILRRDHQNVDFRPLRNPVLNWNDEVEINEDRVRMITACFIHYKFHTPSVVRFIGGVHVGAHRDTAAILKELKGKINDQTHRDLEWLYTRGAPHICQATSSEENFLEFYKYGNHKSVYIEPGTTQKTLVKDFKKNYCLAADQRILPFVYDAHLTLLGMVYIGHKYKNPRPVFDSTFRPQPWCFAINDWTHKDTEPTLRFPSSVARH
jgi:hypothetical protein